MQKAHSETQAQSAPPTKVTHEDGSKDADDNASTRGMVSPTPSTPDEDAEGEKGDGDSETLVAAANGLPSIRVTPDSANENALNGRGAAKDNGVNNNDAVDSLEKPVQAAENQEGESGQPQSQEPFSFSNKRLCERWLDNLFMVLYEVCTGLTWSVTDSSADLCSFRSLTPGSARLDHIPCGGCSLQDATCCIS